MTTYADPSSAQSALRFQFERMRLAAETARRPMMVRREPVGGTWPTQPEPRVL